MKASDKAQELHAELQQKVAELVSGDDWKAMLTVAGRFHRYSFGNVLLIRAQRPEASRVAGFNAWKALGRFVRKGEKGIAILAPVTYRARVSDPPATVGNGSSALEEREDAAQGRRVLRGFRIVHVFDVAQTDGEPLPDVAPELLTGSAPDGLFDRLCQQIAERGFTASLASPDDVATLTGGPRANGVTDYLSRRVLVRDDLAPAQRAKTLAHELAHVLLHSPEGGFFVCRDRIEVEAESVAFVVLRALDQDAGAYSFPYVARWADGNTKLVASTGERVVGAARQILDRLGEEEEAA